MAVEGNCVTQLDQPQLAERRLFIINCLRSVLAAVLATKGALIQGVSDTKLKYDSTGAMCIHSLRNLPMLRTVPTTKRIPQEVQRKSPNTAHIRFKFGFMPTRQFYRLLTSFFVTACQSGFHVAQLVNDHSGLTSMVF